MASIDTPLAVIKSARPSIAGLRILDVGCGAGGLARQLVAEGAQVTGIDPGVQAIRDATIAVPQAVFVDGVAESLPFAAGAFDMAVMMNALHHVPEISMRAALTEAARVLQPDGVLIVIEPMAHGSFFEALRRVEDETVVRHAAQVAIEAAVSAGEFLRETTLDYVRRETFDNAEGFLERVISVDPSRRAVVERSRSTIIDAVISAAAHDLRGRLIFDQPIKADILRPA